MATGGGPRAWAFLRRNPVYRALWRQGAARPVFEAAPFPVCIQSMADRQALEWGLLAWEGPLKINGPVSPFWAEAPMLDGEWGTGAPALPGLLAKSGARLEGLRLIDGTLILKIENGENAAQVRVRAGTGVGIGAGLVLRLGFGHGQADAIARLEDLACLASESGPNRRHGGRGTDGELLTVLDGRFAGKSWRETAVDVYGAKRVAAEWHADGWMRARVRQGGMEGGEGSTFQSGATVAQVSWAGFGAGAGRGNNRRVVAFR